MNRNKCVVDNVRIWDQTDMNRNETKNERKKIYVHERRMLVGNSAEPCSIHIDGL